LKEYAQYEQYTTIFKAVGPMEEASIFQC